MRSLIGRYYNDAIVEATSRQTYFGRTARVVEAARTVSHYRRAIMKIGDFLIIWVSKSKWSRAIRRLSREIARQLDLGANILNASLFDETKHTQTKRFAGAIDQADSFAQVFPEHKFHIVDALQQRGHIVGMTGDGVNDAPSLKKADAGITVSEATDAARAAADIVLLTPGISVIVDALKMMGPSSQSLTTVRGTRINLRSGPCHECSYWRPARRRRGGRKLWTFLLGRAGLPSEPRPDPNADLPETLRCGPPHHFHHADAPAILG